MKDKLSVKTDRSSSANLTSERYFKISIKWEAYSQILEAMEINLGLVMDNISDWENRETSNRKDRNGQKVTKGNTGERSTNISYSPERKHGN
jgi:hypothetical protein